MSVRRVVLVILALAASVAAATARGRPAAGGPRIVRFAGHDWTVKTSGRERVGPGPNYFSDSTDTVWVDAYGRLHLRVARAGNRWTAAEVVSVESFGHGTYRFHVDTPLDALPPSVVLGLFTWDDDPAWAHREIDVEFSRWGMAANPVNAQYAVQPYETPGHLQSFLQPPGAPSTHAFVWLPAAVRFQSLAGDLAAPLVPADVIASWTYEGAVPPAGAEHARMNLWLYQGVAPAGGTPVEAIVSDFTFEP